VGFEDSLVASHQNLQIFCKKHPPTYKLPNLLSPFTTTSDPFIDQGFRVKEKRFTLLSPPLKKLRFFPPESKVAKTKCACFKNEMCIFLWILLDSEVTLKAFLSKL